jgi:hypothetical protein
MQIRTHRAIKDDDAILKSFEKAGHLRIADCRFNQKRSDSTLIGNRRLKIGNVKAPRWQTTRGFHQNCFETAVERLAELFSGLFYVAASRLNSPRLSGAIETLI